MDFWTKHPEEEMLVGRDWTRDLDGATISGTPPDPVLPASSDAELEYIETDGNVTKYWLRGGRPRTSFRVLVRIVTSEGETLGDLILVRIKG